MNSTRRKLLTKGASAAVAAFFCNGKSYATVEDIHSVLDPPPKRDNNVGDEAGIVKLFTPEIAENGNSVPISVFVASQMSAEDYVASVLIVAEGNPNPQVVTFHFTPLSGEAKVKTRMRLAQTQDVLAVAKLSDGSVHKTSNHVKVTIGGCGA